MEKHGNWLICEQQGGYPLRVNLNNVEAVTVDDHDHLMLWVHGPESEAQQAIKGTLAEFDAVVLGVGAEGAAESKALEFIGEYGGIDGGHHKQWVLDQLVRTLSGDDYEKWVADYEQGEDGRHTYSWDEGIAP